MTAKVDANRRMSAVSRTAHDGFGVNPSVRSSRMTQLAPLQESPHAPHDQSQDDQEQNDLHRAH